MQLAVSSTAGVTDGLEFPASTPTMSILMDLEMARVDEPQDALALARKNLDGPAPDPFRTP